MQQDRYCRNCGQELQPEDRFCANCGRSVHATATVPTPQADVYVPPPPQQAQTISAPPQTSQMQTAPRGPIWGMLVVFLVLGIGQTVQGMPATSGRPFSYQLGVGVGSAFASVLGVAAIILFLGGVYYATARKDGASFLESIFNWPLLVVAAIITFVILA